MQVTNTIEKTRELVNNWKKEGKTIGLVPTMGHLHDEFLCGHFFHLLYH